MELDFIIAKEIIRNTFPSKIGIIDVGCHEGAFTEFVLDRALHKNAILIDPLPDKIKAVKDKFPNSTVIQCAVSNEEKEAEFFVTVDFPKCSALYDREAYEHVPALKNRQKINVQIKKLESIFNDINFSNQDVEGWYLKIDTEGYEVESFESLGKYKSDERILAGHFEYGGTWKERGLKINDMLTYLHSFGFLTFKGMHQNNTIGLAKIESINDDYEFSNIYFIKENIVNKLIS